MKRIINYIKISILILISTNLIACKKYLDAKTDKTLVIPSTIQDAQTLLDSYGIFSQNSIPATGTISDDNFFLQDADYDAEDIDTRNVYVWDKAATTSSGAPIANCYKAILSCNVALETLAKNTITPSNEAAYNLARGSALFLRAYMHYNLLIVYCLQYDKSIASSELGLPYNMSSNIQESSTRPSLQYSYDRVIEDAKNAIAILPTSTIFPTRPTKQAVFAFLARIYLSMNDYPNALVFADSCLKIQNSLMDYNNYTAIGTRTPFKRFNAEDIFHSTSIGEGPLVVDENNIDTILYKSYDSNDLRKTLFFVKNQYGYYSFRGGYDENANQGPYGGLAVDEIYLIRAESYARAGNTSAALTDLNTLLRKRWKSGMYTDITAPDAPTALEIVLTERRKELVNRNNLRWTDLKRLNKDPKYAKTLIHVVHSITYTLPPNDKRYAILLPPVTINLSGMQQNDR